MAKEITMNHHERWDGKGYPGHIKDIFKKKITYGPGKEREEIPLSARIVALADVYDALTSHRIYKHPWSNQDVMDYIENERDGHFDPSVVDAFFSIYDIIKAIQEKYSY
jgi:HD-GYP domain-containing protein (c-di-GMP phosphodiesterase class II)